MNNMFASRIPIFLFLIALCLLTAACASDEYLSGYLASNRAALDEPYQEGGESVLFIVEPGTPARAIAEELEKVGLIGDATLFEAYVRVNGIAPRLEAGRFQLSSAMTPIEIAEALQNARADSKRVTIPEGWRFEQVADYLRENDLLDGAEYRRLATNPDELDLSPWPFLALRPAGASLEGYLFPDTYLIPAEEPTAEDLIARQLDNFAQRVLPLLDETGTPAEELYDTLIVASIVEREAVVANERPLIAGVYLNRLGVGMGLDADPTVQYAMGYQSASNTWWKTPVFLEEYGGVDSPYNTYLYAGLPPGPIASPGLSSIRAVLQPAEHNYLYFVATPDGSGAHVFGETYAEHLENVRRYQGR